MRCLRDLKKCTLPMEDKRAFLSKSRRLSSSQSHFNDQKHARVGLMTLNSRGDWIEHPIWKLFERPRKWNSRNLTAPFLRDRSRCKSFCLALSKIFPDPLYDKTELLWRSKDSFIKKKTKKTHPPSKNPIVGPLAMAAVIHSNFIFRAWDARTSLP